MYVISNEIYEVGINNYGAEIEYIKINGIDILWKKTDLWNSQSPILFPIIGALKDEFYFYEDKRYEIEPHGFIKSKVFEVAYLDKNKIILSKKYDKDTLLQYPFKFELKITYCVINNSLSISFEIYNLDDKQISFSIGIHPGFSYSGLSELLGDNFNIKFTPNNANEVIFDPSFVIGKQHNNIPYINLDDMSKDLEIKRTICYEGITSLELFSKRYSLEIINEMSYMAFWQKNPNNNPKFICIEGWEGLPDSVNTEHILMEKKGNVILSKNENFVRNFIIKIKRGE